MKNEKIIHNVVDVVVMEVWCKKLALSKESPCSFMQLQKTISRSVTHMDLMDACC